MSERQLQFRVGLFVIVAFIAAAVMIFEFGELKHYWQSRYALAIHFDSAPGVYRSTPVQRNGVNIGSVTDVVFDESEGGVTVVVEIKEQYHLREDSQARLQLSLLGDATIDFVPGKSPQFLEAGARVDGEPPTDPMQIVAHLDEKLTRTLDSFEATSREWQMVGRNFNSLMETNEGHLNVVIERTALSLKQFSETMLVAQSAIADIGSLVGDRENQENMKKTLAALPVLVDETGQTISMIKSAVEQADATLHSINEATSPLAERSASIATRLDETLGNLQSLTGELNQFAQLATREDGSLHRFVADPELYRNLSQSAASLAVLLNNIEPVIRDLRVFSDKVARHPELMGVGGALKGSSGLKELPEAMSPARNADSSRYSPSRR